VVVDDVELAGVLVDHVELDQGVGDGVLEGVIEAQGPRGAGNEAGGGARVAAGEEGDRVATADELLGEGGDDPLGTASVRGATIAIFISLSLRVPDDPDDIEGNIDATEGRCRSPRGVAQVDGDRDEIASLTSGASGEDASRSANRPIGRHMGVNRDWRTTRKEARDQRDACSQVERFEEERRVRLPAHTPPPRRAHQAERDVVVCRGAAQLQEAQQEETGEADTPIEARHDPSARPLCRCGRGSGGRTINLPRDPVVVGAG